MPPPDDWNSYDQKLFGGWDAFDQEMSVQLAEPDPIMDDEWGNFDHAWGLTSNRTLPFIQHAESEKKRADSMQKFGKYYPEALRLLKTRQDLVRGEDIAHIPSEDRELFMGIWADLASTVDYPERSLAYKTFMGVGLATTRSAEAMESFSRDVVGKAFGLGNQAGKEDHAFAKGLSEILRARDPMTGDSPVEQGFLGATRMIPDIGASLAASVFAGGPQGMWAYWIARTQPDLKTAMIQQGIDPQIAHNASMAAAVPIAGIEMFQIKQYAPGATAVAKEGIKKSVIDLVKSRAGRIGKLFVLEWGEELGQEIVEVGTKAAAHALDEHSPGMDWPKQLNESLENMLQITLSLPFLLGPGQAVGTIQDIKGMDVRLAETLTPQDRMQPLTSTEADYAFTRPQAFRQPLEAPSPTQTPGIPSKSVTESLVVSEETAEQQRLEERREQLPKMSQAELIDMQRILPENDPLQSIVNEEIRKRATKSQPFLREPLPQSVPQPEFPQQPAKPLPKKSRAEEITRRYAPPGDDAGQDFAKNFVRPLVKRLERGGWNTSTDLTAKQRSGRKPIATTSKILKKLREMGEVEIAWNKQGEPHYAIKGEQLPSWLTQSEQLEFPQQPPKPAIRGKQTEISTPGTGKGIAATYAAMDLADLTPSHDFTTGRPKSNVEAGKYPEGLQPREYAPDSAESEKVSQFVREGKSQFFISTHPAADSGPPTVTPDGIVINGTGRVMTLQRAGKLGKFSWYKRELLNQAESFGIGKDAIAKMKRPVLVRVVEMSPGSQEATQFARAGNVSATQAQSPARTAAALSGLIDNEILDSIHLDEETTFSEAVKTGPQSKAFRSAIEGALPPQQRPLFFNNDGTLTESGTDLVRHMLLTKILPVETVERLGENRRGLKRTLEGAIPQLLKIRRDFRSSDITPQLNEALEFMLRNPDVQTVGQTNDLLAQGSLFGGKVEAVSPGGRMLLDFLLENGNRPRVFRKKLATFLRDLTQGSGLFAEDLPEISVMAAESLGVMRRPGAEFGPGRTASAKPQQKPRTVQEPKVHATGVPSTQPVSRAGAVAPFALQSAETTEGGKLLARLRNDSKRRGPKRVGPRSIIEFVNQLTHTTMLVGKTQTSKPHPAHFQRQAHIVRSRSGVWQINLHEAGHALSYLLKDRKPQWHKSLSPGLIALTQMQGSMASAKSAEEGMAELVRRYIVDYGSIPGSLREQFEAVAESLDPEIIKGLRDAHRAYQFQQSRPIEEQLESLQNDKPPKPPLTEGIKDVVYRVLYNMIGGAPVLHRIHRRAFAGIGGDTLGTKYDPTGLIGLAKSTVDGVYRSQQKLAREFAAQVEDTPADFRSAYQSTIHIPQEVQRALYGVQQGREGIRVRATGEGFAELLEEEREILMEGGFEIPTETVRHGNWIQLSDKSFSTIKHEVGDADWSAFVLYGQYKSALERNRKEGHDYPGRLDGLTPQKLEQWIAAQEQSHAGWEKQFREINKLMDQLLLVSVLSGEYTATEAVRIRTKWEDYWPLPRQIEDRRGRRSGGGAEPSSGLYRAFGSPLPFRSLEEAVELRVKQALEAYYTNRMMLAVKTFGDELDKLKGAPFDVRKDAKRLMLPLHLETKKAATLKPLEEAEIIANGINRILAEQMGVNVVELPDDVRVRVEDVIISKPGRSLWRARKPNAVHVVAPFENGRRRYYQVPDPLLFDLFSQGKSPDKYFAWLSKVFVKPLAPWKRAITQNIAFGIINFVSRDPSTAMFMGKGEKSLIPYFYGTVGIINRIKGTNLDAVSESELLSKALDHTTRDAHRTVTDSFFGMLKEGVAIPGYSDTSLWDKLAELPGQFMSTLMKPIDVVNWITGGRFVSQLGEKLTREGAYIETVRNGFSEEKAQQNYDEITGNFGQRQGNPNAAEFVRAAGFLNPAIQIGWGQVQRVTDPDPKVRAFYVAAKLPWIAAVGAIGAAINHLMIHAMYDDDEKELIFENMRERTDKERLSTMAIGGKIRLPFDYGLIGSVSSYGWNSTEEMLLDDKINGKTKAEELLRRARDLPTPIDAMYPCFKTGAELWLNHSFFFDDEIVPGWMETQYPYNPELQVFPDTPELYRKIGKGLKVSPIKVRYAVRSFFTRQLDDVVNVLDKQGKELPVELQDFPVARRLSVKEARGFRSQSVRSLTDLDRQWEAADKSLQELKRKPGNETNRLKQIRADLADAHDIMLDVEELWQQVKQARNRPSPDYEQIKALERRMTVKAKSFMEWREKDGQKPRPVRRDRDIVTQAGSLSRLRPHVFHRGVNRDNLDEKRAEWEAGIDSALEWFRDRGIKPAEVRKVYREGEAKRFQELNSEFLQRRRTRSEVSAHSKRLWEAYSGRLNRINSHLRKL